MTYIEREALGIGKANRDIFENPAYADGWNAAIDIIEAAPAVEATPVVRCKDCKHYTFKIGSDNCGYCMEHSLDYMCADDFCSYGEKRED